MKASNVTYLFITLCWMTLLTFAAFILPKESWIVLSLLGLILLGGVLTFLHVMVFFPLSQLDQELKNVVENNNADFSKVISTEVNELIDDIKKLLAQTHETDASSSATRQALEASEQTNALLREEIIKQKARTSLQQQQQQLQQRMPLSKLAHYDINTSLPNRIFFNEILNKALSHAKRRKQICSLLSIGLDDYTDLIIQLRPEQLQILTKSVSTRLLNTLRAEDVLARFNDDQYMVLLADIKKPKFASSVAEKLLYALSKPFDVEDKKINLSASIGICIYPNDGNSLELLLQNADIALERARATKQGSYEFYAHELNIEAKEFITLDAALRKALQKNELALYYQPKFRIKTGNIDGVEALLRWVHPELGNIDATKIVAIAEETGLTIKLAEWTLTEACRANKHWQEEGYEHMTVAVNISPMQFHHPDIVDIIKRALVETNLNPAYLEIEVNETAVMEDTQAATNILEAFKNLGVQITLDHFGTGYTSISHLKRFPINFLKIDRNYVKGLPNNPNDMAIINAFLALAHNLGLEVIAEGVESAEQVQYLSLQNCDLVQGYFLSHPLPPERLIVQLNELRDEVLI